MKIIQKTCLQSVADFDKVLAAPIVHTSVTGAQNRLKKQAITGTMLVVLVHHFVMPCELVHCPEEEPISGTSYVKQTSYIL